MYVQNEKSLLKSVFQVNFFVNLVNLDFWFISNVLSRLNLSRHPNTLTTTITKIYMYECMYEMKPLS